MEVEVDGCMEVEVQVDTCSLVYSHQLQIGQEVEKGLRHLFLNYSNLV